MFPWVAIHNKCFELMQRLLEYRSSVLHLRPDDSIIRTNHKSTRIPTSLGEMYEVYQSRIYTKPCAKWGWSHEYAWKVLEPHRYYYNGQFYGPEHIELFSLLEWPWGSRYAIVSELVLII